MLTARLAQDPRDRSDEARVLHRSRPDAGADRPVGAAVRHAELGGARRLLLGEHGGRRPVHDRLFVLGVRRARLGSREVLRAVGRGRGPFVQSDQDRPRQAEAPRREVRLDQSDPHRLFGDRRRVDPGAAGHRRLARAGDRPRAAHRRDDRLRVPRALHQRAVARDRRRRVRARTGCSRATRRDGRWCSTRRRGRSSTRRALDIRPALFGACTLPDGRAGHDGAVARRRALSRRALRAGEPSPTECGVPAETIRSSRAKWRRSRSTKRSSCRSAGPTCGGATHDKRGRPAGRDVRDARHLRALATASIPAARCT